MDGAGTGFTWAVRSAARSSGPLVKQVEVDYTEIRVVFRIEPGPIVLDSATDLCRS